MKIGRNIDLAQRGRFSLTWAAPYGSLDRRKEVSKKWAHWKIL